MQKFEVIIENEQGDFENKIIFSKNVTELKKTNNVLKVKSKEKVKHVSPKILDDLLDFFEVDKIAFYKKADEIKEVI